MQNIYQELSMRKVVDMSISDALPLNDYYITDCRETKVGWECNDGVVTTIAIEFNGGEI